MPGGPEWGPGEVNPVGVDRSGRNDPGQNRWLGRIPVSDTRLSRIHSDGPRPGWQGTEVATRLKLIGCDCGGSEFTSPKCQTRHQLATGRQIWTRSAWSTHRRTWMGSRPYERCGVSPGLAGSLGLAIGLWAYWKKSPRRLFQNWGNLPLAVRVACPPFGIPFSAWADSPRCGDSLGILPCSGRPTLAGGILLTPPDRLAGRTSGQSGLLHLPYWEDLSAGPQTGWPARRV